jgi:hypothetical protein
VIFQHEKGVFTSRTWLGSINECPTSPQSPYLIPTPPTHANYWLLGSTNAETVCSKDLLQAQTYHTPQELPHLSPKNKETEDPHWKYKRYHSWTNWHYSRSVINVLALSLLFFDKLTLCFCNFTSNSNSGHDVNKSKV